MAKVDLKIKAKDTSGNALTSTISYVNPALTNAQLSTLAHNLNGLTDNFYDSSQKVTTVNVDGESGGGQQKPTLTVTTDDNVTIVDGGTYNMHSGSYIDVTYNGDATVLWSIEPGNGNGNLCRLFGKDPQNPKWTINYNSGTYTVIIFAPETENYQAAQISFTATFSS